MEENTSQAKIMASENIQFLSTSLVQATTSKETNQRIDLTPCDIRFLLVGCIQKGLLFAKPKSAEGQKSADTENMIQRLKSSLSCTLDFFTPLAGRLAKVEHDDNTISYFIDCNNKGAQFVHAVADGVTIADILEPTYVPSVVYSFFPLNGLKNYEGVSKPLLGVQVTELVDGIFVGCTLNHLAGDGTSFWNFMNSWSEISRGSGQDRLFKPPVLDRWLSCNDRRHCPIRIPISVIKSNSNHNFIPPPVRERVFHCSKANIAWLKAKANAESGTDKISSLQSLLAHLWRSVIRSRIGVVLEPDQEIDYNFLIGYRSRLQPPLAEQYFGNAVVHGVVTLKARELVEHGLGYVALQMNKMIALHTDDKVRSILDSWTENPKPVRGTNISRLFTSSSPRCNVYGNDFGWGKPVAARSGPGNKYDGKITLFAGIEEGSVDIEVCVFPETLQALANDLEFMEAVSTV